MKLKVIIIALVCVLLALPALSLLGSIGGGGGGGTPGVEACVHRDANDNGRCDNCGNAYSDGCDSHRDSNDDGACDKCSVAHEDGCDVHRDADDNGECDTCGSEFTDGCENHVDANDSGKCDNCDAAYDDGHDVHYDYTFSLSCDVCGANVPYTGGYSWAYCDLYGAAHIDEDGDFECDYACGESCREYLNIRGNGNHFDSPGVITYDYPDPVSKDRLDFTVSANVTLGGNMDNAIVWLTPKDIDGNRYFEFGRYNNTDAGRSGNLIFTPIYSNGSEYVFETDIKLEKATRQIVSGEMTEPNFYLGWFSMIIGGTSYKVYLQIDENGDVFLSPNKDYSEDMIRIYLPKAWTSMTIVLAENTMVIKVGEERVTVALDALYETMPSGSFTEAKFITRELVVDLVLGLDNTYVSAVE